MKDDLTASAIHIEQQPITTFRNAELGRYFLRSLADPGQNRVVRTYVIECGNVLARNDEEVNRV